MPRVQFATPPSGLASARARTKPGLIALGSLAAAAAMAAPATATATSSPGTIEVSSSSGSSSLQNAVNAAKPGDVIRVHGGTYSGQIRVTHSGTASQRITLTAFGDGAVNLVTNYPKPSCGASGPATSRTIDIRGGADYWTFSNLNIIGGVFVAGVGAGDAHHYLANLVSKGDWQSRRAIPGRGKNDPVAARNAISYVDARVGARLDPSDGLSFLRNTITQRGIHVNMGRYGVIDGNTVHAIDCGTGPGMWINTFSDGWKVTNNHVYDVAASTHQHYMQEGIRFGTASNYNLITGNLVENLPADGRALTTDVDASFNTFTGNTARNVNIGFNDEMSGWGNEWSRNTASGFRDTGFNFRGMDSPLKSPSMDTSTYMAKVFCNRSSGGPADMYAGALIKSTFSGNSFGTVKLGPNLQEYWSAQGNTWNGSSKPPALHPATSTSGC